MGQINHPVKLKELISELNLCNFVETGTGDGSSMDKVLLTDSIQNCYGIECDEELFDALVSKYKNNETVHLYNDYSENCMETVLKDMDDSPALFWLDAHFPGSDYKGMSYGSEENIALRLPMETELQIMKDNRDLSNDVIIMDDLRIYVDRDFGAGNWPERSLYGADDYDFVENIIGDTHILVEHLGDQGYLLAFPIKNTEEKLRQLIK
jgi:hypothetical protein